MTAREHAAFTAGIRRAADLALIVVVTIERRPDADHIRQRAAVEALRGLAAGLMEQTAKSETVSDIDRRGRSIATDRASAVPALREEGVAAGYTGDACPNCDRFTMHRAGTCLACDACGSTTGCS